MNSSRRVRHDRGARCDLAGAGGIPGRRPVNRCIAVDRRITDHAEPWQWLGQHELPEYVGDRL